MAGLMCALSLLISGAADPVAGALDGEQPVGLRLNDGRVMRIGTVNFRTADHQTMFKVRLDPTLFDSYFLSMREFKCLNGRDLQCHVPYPYPMPSRVTDGDLRWLEHSLLFFVKSPKQYGARLTEGVYYQLRWNGRGFVGRPYWVDLDKLAVPPADNLPPISVEQDGVEARDDRWISQLLIGGF
ncbi:hypothetical protein C1T17_20815 (plasmid) [Sphingobium sp. SCG-1]|nr:hypothetical protein C1T17_19745 [Sphingobium sp. SCG-1]AUW60646.1 hypothetical protein C1T17_20815 [Sphingobium sp. SCG-1]